MAITVSQLLETALALSPESRVALAEQLIGSVPPESPFFRKQASEARRRDDDMEAGRVVGIPGHEGLRQVREAVLRQAHA